MDTCVYAVNRKGKGICNPNLFDEIFAGVLDRGYLFYEGELDYGRMVADMLDEVADEE